MWLQTSCDLVFDISVPTPFVLMLRPRSGALQWVAREEYKIDPSVPVFEFTDNYGNLCQRLVAPEGHFSIHTSSRVMIADILDRAPGAPFVEVQMLPGEVLGFLLPSRYCESDRFGHMANQITEDCLPGYDQVAAIEAWLRNTFRYEPGVSDLLLSAQEVNQQPSGVCRDFAHLGIALCRSLCIPARMVVGYLHNLQPMDLHAWFEAYVGGRWYTFDATQYDLFDTYRKGGYVTLGYGRDAADVAIFNQYGPAVIPIEQRVSVERLNTEAD
ncbi:transglutaminase family protein [Amphritea opalescens]|uniref:Transglutaminase family protein n=1 Tax=Amphritea opalescens TaxID=2490544 RepID=A0A430KUX3_9GAMM|nr:transglutaminase family protein [Amphritea opalescens]RTE67134.1 transglutaminase family protein [Amphritea opalescens]